MTPDAGETQIKNGEESSKDCLVEWFGKTCVIRYKGEIYNRISFEKLPFIGNLGWVAVLFAGIIYIVLGICSQVVFMLIVTYAMDKINLLLGSLLSILFLIPIVLFFGGASLLGDIFYVKNTTCKKCHKKCAYEEREIPDIKEISTENLYKVTITRYWKCKHCGNIDTSEGREKIIYCNKGRKGRKVKIKCEKCGKTRILPECRKPDAKVYDSVLTEIRYYRCQDCGHINMAVDKNYGSRVDAEVIRWESGGSDPRLEF